MTCGPPGLPRPEEIGVGRLTHEIIPGGPKVLMASMGYKDGDFMDEDEYQLPELDLDKVYKTVTTFGAMLEGETLDKAQESLWTIKASMPFVDELIKRLPALLDTVIDGLQEAAARRGRPPIIQGVPFPPGTVVVDEGPLVCTCGTKYNDGTCPRCFPLLGTDPHPVDQVDEETQHLADIGEDKGHLYDSVVVEITEGSPTEHDPVDDVDVEDPISASNPLLHPELRGDYHKPDDVDDDDPKGDQ